MTLDVNLTALKKLQKLLLRQHPILDFRGGWPPGGHGAGYGGKWVTGR